MAKHPLHRFHVGAGGDRKARGGVAKVVRRQSRKRGILLLNPSNTAARLFLHMCLECWDDEDNPAKALSRRYFGRRELSASALGFLAPDNGSEAAFRAVKRAIKELVDKGAIVRVGHGGNGRPAEFELQVDSTRPRVRGREPVVIAFPGFAQGADSSTPERASF